MQLATETPLNSSHSPDMTAGTDLTTFNLTVEVNAAVNHFFDLRSPGAAPVLLNR